MKSLLIFPPGWNPCGPYLALPLLKGYLEQQGRKVDILDLNIELFDWALSADTLRGLRERLAERENRGRDALGAHEYARVCMGLLRLESLAGSIEAAKRVMRMGALFNDQAMRTHAQKTIAEALDLVGAAFDGVAFSTQQIYFRSCGLDPEKVAEFAKHPDNLVRRFFDDFGADLPDLSEYGLIGFSVACWEQLAPAATIAQAIRDRGFTGHLCFGGNYTTRMVKMWEGRGPYFEGLIDSYSLYEGEESLALLLDAVEGGGGLDHIPNLAFFDQGTLVTNDYRPVPVSHVSPPNFDGFALKKYLMPELILPVFASRGCGYNCAFCSIPYASGKFQRRSESEVVSEIATLRNRYETRHFTFVDEILTLETLESIADQLISSGIDIRWYGETRFHPKMTKDKTRRLYASGCRKLQFGMESYSQRVLNLMRKGTRIEHMLPNVEACLESGIAVHLFAILGFPGETEEEALLTHEFCGRVLALSEETYGLPFSSVGLSPFRLSFFSDVHLHPERYEVELLDLRERDTPLDIFSIGYRTRTGMSPEQADALSQRLRLSAQVESLRRRLGVIDPSELAPPHLHEEEGFLLYVYRQGFGGAGVADDSGPPAAAPRQVLGHEFDIDVALAPGTVMRRFRSDPLRDDGSGEPVVVFHDPESGTIDRCPAWQADELGLGPTPVRYASGALGDHSAATLSRLLYNRLASARGRGVIESSRERPEGGSSGTTVVPNPNVSAAVIGEGGFYLVDLARSTAIEVNPMLAWLMNRISGRAVSDDLLYREVRDVFPNFPRSRLDDALIALTEADAVGFSDRPGDVERVG